MNILSLPPLVIIETPQLIIRMPVIKDSANILAYYNRNIKHLKPFEPLRPPDFYTISYWKKHIKSSRKEYKTCKSMHLLIYKKDNEKLIGMLNFTAFERGTIQSCRVGYSVDKEHCNQGFMKEALEAGIKHVFDRCNLHRVQSAYLPHNTASEKVLSAVGFQKEGIARSYLLIDGRWQDHIIASVINPYWKPSR